MDNFGRNNQDSKNFNESVSLSKDSDEPNFFDDKTTVSHSPLDLGGGGTTQAPKINQIKPVVKSPAPQTASSERITGVKTFFTKLHAGAIEFLDEQITKWLKENPSIAIKQTNITTGEIQGKKTEPNIIITVWY